jgi:peptidoglycan hydrolase CwlO-like protein
MLPPDHPLTIALAALISGFAAWVASQKRTVRRSPSQSKVEKLVAQAVASQYQQLVEQVTLLAAEVEDLRADVTERDARIDELEADKRIAQGRIAELEREVSELRAQLGQRTSDSGQ